MEEGMIDILFMKKDINVFARASIEKWSRRWMLGQLCKILLMPFISTDACQCSAIILKQWLICLWNLSIAEVYLPSKSWWPFCAPFLALCFPACTIDCVLFMQEERTKEKNLRTAQSQTHFKGEREVSFYLTKNTWRTCSLQQLGLTRLHKTTKMIHGCLRMF